MEKSLDYISVLLFTTFLNLLIPIIVVSANVNAQLIYNLPEEVKCSFRCLLKVWKRLNKFLFLIFIH